MHVQAGHERATRETLAAAARSGHASSRSAATTGLREAAQRAATRSSEHAARTTRAEGCSLRHATIAPATASAPAPRSMDSFRLVPSPMMVPTRSDSFRLVPTRSIPTGKNRNRVGMSRNESEWRPCPQLKQNPSSTVARMTRRAERDDAVARQPAFSTPVY